MFKENYSKIHISILLSCAVFYFAIVFYFGVGKPVLEGELDFQFYADSLTYEKLYYSDYFSGIEDAVGFGGNYLGPLLILELFDGSRVGILVFNCFIFLASIKLIVGVVKVHPILFVFLLLLNPITFFSLISVNKEIVSFFVCALLVRWLFSGALIWVIFAFFCAFLVRWQMALFVLFAFLSFSRINLFRRKRALYLSIVLLAISFLYYQIGHIFENVNAVAQAGAESNDGSGLFSLFNRLQAQGFYFLIFIPKALHAMFGLVSNVGSIINPSSIYNDLVITINAVTSFLLFLTLILVGRFQIKSDLVFLLVLYCVVFTLSPIYSPRYFYPVFIFTSIALANRQKKTIVRCAT